MTRYTAATATNIITKLKENGNSGIDGILFTFTVKSAEAKLSQFVGLSEMQIVYLPTVAPWGTGISISIEPVEDTVTESLAKAPKNMRRLAPGVKPLPEIVTILSIGPIVGLSVIDASA